MLKSIKETFFSKTFHVLAVLLYAALFCTSLFITGVNRKDRLDEFIILENTSFLRMLLIILTFGIMMFLAGILYDKVIYKCNRNVLLGIVCIAALLLGIYWVGASGTEPEADQGMICAYANALNDGDFNGIWEGRYLARYSQQLGLTTFLRLFFRIWGRGNYMSFQYFNAFMPPVIIFSGCQIVRKLFGNNGRIEAYFLLLMLTCFPMYAYTAFVYGELSSTAMVMLATWLLLSCLEKFSVPKILGLALTAGLAVQLRANALIVLVAFGIVAIVRFIHKPDWKILATGLSVLAGFLMLHAAVRLVYYDVWDKEAKSIPLILWVAMGLHESEGHPGWNDNYEYIIFAESGDDIKVSTKIAHEDIKESLDRFREDPKYMWYFYKAKIDMQWQAPMYQCIVMNNNIVRDQSRIVQMIYEEELLGRLIKQYMKAYQVFMYGCILLWLLAHRKKNMSIEKYVLLIAVFGGFLFSIIWEAKTRYVFPYLLLMTPYFASGLDELTAGLARMPQMLRDIRKAKATDNHESE